MNESFKELKFDMLFFNNNPLFWDKLLIDDERFIDLRQYDFIEPEAASFIAFIARYRKSLGKKTLLVLKPDSNVVNYMNAIGLHLIADGQYIHFYNATEIELAIGKYVYSDQIENHLAKLIRIDGSHISLDLEKLKFFLKNFLIEGPFKNYKNTNIGDLITDRFKDTVIELIRNIIQHGGNEFGLGAGYCSLVPPRSGSQYLRYTFSDIGKGFKHTLSEKESPDEICKLNRIDSDFNAIVKGLLFRKLIKKERIIGLFPVLGIICATRGSIGIRSGTSIVEIDFSKDKNYKKFKDNYFSGNDRTMDENIENYFKSIIRSKESIEIPGTHIYINVGLGKPDINFLQDIDNNLKILGAL